MVMQKNMIKKSVRKKLVAIIRIRFSPKAQGGTDNSEVERYHSYSNPHHFTSSEQHKLVSLETGVLQP